MGTDLVRHKDRWAAGVKDMRDIFVRLESQGFSREAQQVRCACLHVGGCPYVRACMLHVCVFVNVCVRARVCARVCECMCIPSLLSTG